MVDYEYSTLWEYWNKDGTLNHAWSGGPHITMSKYIAGIRPVDNVYITFEIKPHMGDLNFIKCKVPSVKGDIVLDLQRENGRITLRAEIPPDSKAKIYLPFIDRGNSKRYGYVFTMEGSGGE